MITTNPFDNIAASKAYYNQGTKSEYGFGSGEYPYSTNKVSSQQPYTTKASTNSFDDFRTNYLQNCNLNRPVSNAKNLDIIA